MTVEGRGDSTGSLAATKVRFDKNDFKVAQSIDTRVGPAEQRLTVAEQNAQRLVKPAYAPSAGSKSNRSGLAAVLNRIDLLKRSGCHTLDAARDRLAPVWWAAVQACKG